MKKKTALAVLAAVLSASILSGCEGKSKEVSSKDDSQNTKTESVDIKNEGDPVMLATMTDEESRLIGTMMQQVLEANGYEVDSKVGTFNNTTLIRQSLQQKQAELSMDYTGRGMMFIKDVDITKYQSDMETAFQTTKVADAENGIVWMCYAPYNNTDGIAVGAKWAEENKIETFEDFAKYVNDGGEMKLAVNGENSYVTTAETCLPGWEEAYGFHLDDSQLVVGVTDSKTMAAENTDGVLASHTYTTAGTLDALELYVLKDTKVVSPVYSPAPVATQEFIDKYPEVEELMKPIFEAIDEDTMRALNTKLSVDGISETEIAKDFLKEKGIVE